jgi:NADH dehydrogenase FAD-containing subunit
MRAHSNKATFMQGVVQKINPLNNTVTVKLVASSYEIENVEYDYLVICPDVQRDAAKGVALSASESESIRH